MNYNFRCCCNNILISNNSFSSPSLLCRSMHNSLSSFEILASNSFLSCKVSTNSNFVLRTKLFYSSLPPWFLCCFSPVLRGSTHLSSFLHRLETDLTPGFHPMISDVWIPKQGGNNKYLSLKANILPTSSQVALLISEGWSGEAECFNWFSCLPTLRPTNAWFDPLLLNDSSILAFSTWPDAFFSFDSFRVNSALKSPGAP